ncbi:MAG: group II truncated hemoglobin [Burkholderiales bacterium]
MKSSPLRQDAAGQSEATETLHRADLPPLAPLVANPHYQQIGGADGIKQLVARFYALMDEIPEARTIRALHPSDLTQSRARLFMFLSGWLGGPQLYAERYGHPRLRQKHQPFPIGEAERDAWMLCMTRALDEQAIAPPLRERLAQAFFKTADFLRNIQGVSP